MTSILEGPLVKLSLNDRFQLFLGNLLQNNNRIITGLSIIGGLWLTCKAATVARVLYQSFLRPAKDIPHRYGEKSWVLVTGASDGLGAVFAREFAALHFNIVLFGRNAAKLQSVSDELKKVYNVETRIIVADFSKCLDNSESYWGAIEGQLAGLNISILVNNAGYLHREQFEKETDQNLKDTFVINCVAPTFLMRRVIPKMLERVEHADKKKQVKCAIINVSSMLALFPHPYYSMYCATKSFLSQMSKSLAMEFSDKIDIVDWCPSTMTTRFTGFLAPSIRTLTPEDAVKGILRCLGHEKSTNAHWKHRLVWLTTSCQTEAAKINFARGMLERQKAKEKEATQKISSS